MANEQRGEVSFSLGGTEYVLRPSFDVLANIESDLKFGMAGLTQLFIEGKYGFREIEAIFRRGIAGAGVKPPDNLKELLFSAGLPALSVPAARFVFGSISGDPKEPPAGEAPAP